MKHTKTRPNTSNNQGKDTYLADLEVRRPMELQGAVEVALNQRADLVLRLSGRFLLPLVAEKLQGDPVLDDRPMTGPLGRTHAEHLLGGRHELDNPVGSGAAVSSSLWPVGRS